MLNLQQAIDLATEAHKGQFRRPFKQLHESSVEGAENTWLYDDEYLVRLPYITHPLAVMEMMTTEEEKIVAVLHDVIEDTSLFLEKSKSTGNYYIMKTIHDIGMELTEEVYLALKVLTKVKGQKYKDYLFWITMSKLAIKVKIADMFHNISDNCTDSMKKRYFKAIKYLLQD